jgi:hypothetical protein
MTKKIRFNGSPERYCTAGELGDILHVSPDTVNNWAEKFLDFPRLTLPNNGRRFRVSEAKQWLSEFRKESRQNG